MEKAVRTLIIFFFFHKNFFLNELLTITLKTFISISL